MEDDILDPAHSDTVVVAGHPDPLPQPDTRILTEDGNLVEHNGRRYVPEEALKGERSARQQLASTLNRLEPVLPEFEEYLANKRSGNVAAQQRTAPAAEELAGYAQLRGYFKSDGTPDTVRARADLDFMDSRVDTRARAIVKPVEEMSAKERARANRIAAGNAQYVDGQPIAGATYLDAAYNALPPELAADGNISNLVQVIAAGLQSLDERKTGKSSRPARREPMYLEGSRGRYDGDTGELSNLELAAARARGKSPTEWAKTAAKVVKAPNQFDDL